MTIDEAVRILDPKTTAEALAEVEYYGGFSGQEAVIKAVEDACLIAIGALERQKMLPPGEGFEYISRCDIMKKLTAAEAQKAVREMDGGEAYNWILELVNFAPAADVEPVRHERWIVEGEFRICPVCEAEINIKNSLGAVNHKNYCPNCGSKMDLEGKGNDR